MVKQFKMVKDSGKRQNFDTGSKRDTDEGKGNPHLIAGEPFVKVKEYLKIADINYPTFYNVNQVLDLIEDNLFNYTQLVRERDENLDLILDSINLTCVLINFDEDVESEEEIYLWYNAFNRLAIHYQNGAIKYDANNWRLGQPVSRYYDSAQRHLWKIGKGLTDEDHYAALLWNLIAIVQTKIDVDRGLLPKELNDYPFTIEEVFEKKGK